MIRQVEAVGNWWEALYRTPTIPVVRREEDLPAALEAQVAWVFLACGDINSIAGPVERVRNAGKLALLYVDFISGLGADPAAVRFVSSDLHADGVVSVKGQVVQHAREQGLWAVQNLFVIDSQAVQTGLQAVIQSRPHAVEILPGIIPRVIAEVVEQTEQPVIAGGLLESRSDADRALAAGATAVATSKPGLWPGAASRRQ